jgi:O-antigen/teichoic acid export membrane protein
MSLKRILKLFVAFLTSQGVSLVTQLLVPPMFLRSYSNGVEIYGEWLALTAAVSYLGTLNYGIQNYANNQMTIHYNRGELDRAKVVQASALRLVLIVIGAFVLLGTAILFMPLGDWMGLRYVSAPQASWTLFLMMMQLAIFFLLAFLADSFMVIGEAHRGQAWQSIYRLSLALVLALFAWRQASFPVLAASQLIACVLCTLACLLDIRLRAPILLPSLRYGTRTEMMAQIKPSAYFMLLSVGNFLIWQAPLLLIEKILGPAAVTIFALTRTIFSMSRQILAVATLSIRAEITRLVGQRDWTGLKRLYDLSEKVILLLTPVSTVGTLLISPLLFTVWLHKRSLYDPWMCLLLAAVSAVIAIKEHKFQFQWSSNQHITMSRFNVIAYLGMLILSALLMRPFGVYGFVVIWLITEIWVSIFIVLQNRKLFPKEIHVSMKPMFHLFGVLVVAFGLSAWPVFQGVHWGLAKITGVAVLVMGILTVACYFVFGLNEVREVVMRKLRHKLATQNPV